MKDQRIQATEDQSDRVPGEDFQKSFKVIPVFEEQVHLDKKIVETGKVTISKKTVEHEETVDDFFRYEDVQVERVEVNEYITDGMPPTTRHEGETMIIPVFKEVLVVEKRLLLVEEIRITKKQVEQPYQTQVTLRKEEVTVERTDPQRIPDPTDNNE
ncbi:YsnF/AvaK domain-containing protein [Telluribacter sp.]|jgi:uncharacterized protein (TIGR02271 family)|uniref:YsnF/AvaK domain-containing protein n=1 Tax=Telluribacter sp. TaxID=1978767 RepID=UPI002E146EB2|nr:YsnF/AvaK domain-containing protein [Telluribacter sp.]